VGYVTDRIDNNFHFVIDAMGGFIVDEGSRSFLSMTADGRLQLFCFFSFPMLHQRDNGRLEVILIVFVLILFIAYFIQFMRLRNAHERQRDLSRSLDEQHIRIIIKDNGKGMSTQHSDFRPMEAWD
jgi:hypothetical protein